MRSLFGPTIAGVAIWCALGRITLATPDSASMRLAVPVSLLLLPAAILLAGLIPGWRRRPISATPALLSTVPWWPVPLPPVALIWTGWLAWAPIALALMASIETGAGGDSVRERWAGSVRPLRSATLAGALTFVAALATASSLSPQLPTGDEPHYLVITQSLLVDGDLKIENNHDRRDYASYFGGDLAPDFIQRGRDGEIYSIHAPGTSVLVLPAFAMFGYRGAQVTIILLAALTGALIWYVGWLATGAAGAAWFAWLAIALSTTFLVQSVTIFPDGPAAFVVAASLALLLRLDDPARGATPAVLVTSGTLLATLPWFHTRLVVLAAGFGVLIVGRLLADAGRRPVERWRRAGLFLLVPAASAAGWLLFFQLIYGTPSPSAAYGPNPEMRFAYIPGGVVALLFDQQFGLLTCTPVLVAAAAGLLARGRGQAGRVMWGVASVAALYLATVATYWMWWAGVPATPARFAADALPLLALPLAVGWKRSGPAARAIWQMLLAVSLGSSVLILGVNRGVMAWNTRGPRSRWLTWLNGVVDLSRGWPSFFWELRAGVVGSEAHFASHVAVWAGVFVLSGVALVVIQRRAQGTYAGAKAPASEEPGAPLLAAAWWFALTLMVAVECGWSLNGVAGADPASSQVAMLGALADGQRALEIQPFVVRRVASAASPIRIRASRTDADDGTGKAWEPLYGVPPGVYAIKVSERRPRGGSLLLHIGSTPEPFRSFRLAATSVQTLTLPLPAGATALVIDPDPILSASAESIELTPVRSDASNGTLARSTATIGQTLAFFFDRNVFVEDTGFWIHSGETAEFAFDAPAGASSMTIDLANGAAPNALVVETGGTSRTVTLGASESGTLVVPVGSNGLARVRLEAPAGFRPSDAGTSRDERYLGVRVSVVSP